MRKKRKRIRDWESFGEAISRLPEAQTAEGHFAALCQVCDQAPITMVRDFLLGLIVEGLIDLADDDWRFFRWAIERYGDETLRLLLAAETGLVDVRVIATEDCKTHETADGTEFMLPPRQEMLTLDEFFQDLPNRFGAT